MASGRGFAVGLDEKVFGGFRQVIEKDHVGGGW